MNDSSVSTINTSVVKSAKPYMMFYFKDEKKSEKFNGFKIENKNEKVVDLEIEKKELVSKNQDFAVKYEFNDKDNYKSIDEIFKSYKPSFLPSEKEIKIGVKILKPEILKEKVDEQIIIEEKTTNDLNKNSGFENLNETKMEIENSFEKNCFISAFLSKKIAKFLLNSKKINQVRSLTKKLKFLKGKLIFESTQQNKTSQKTIQKLNHYSVSELKQLKELNDLTKNQFSDFNGMNSQPKDEYDKEYDLGKMKKIHKREIREKPDFQQVYQNKVQKI